MTINIHSGRDVKQIIYRTKYSKYSVKNTTKFVYIFEDIGHDEQKKKFPVFSILCKYPSVLVFLHLRIYMFDFRARVYVI